jgi:hypothetical protein
MAWGYYYYPPNSPNPWKPRSSLQAAENYLHQKLGRPTYGYSQRVRQVHLRPIAPTYYQQPAAPQYYQPPVQRFYEQAAPLYYQQPMQQYYQSPLPQYFEQAAPRYAPLGVGTENIPKLPQDWDILFS